MAPAADIIRRQVASPSHEHAHGVLEQLVGIAPLVILELPRLACRKHCNDAVPVFGLELLRPLDKDETHRSVGVDAGDDALDVKHRGGGRSGIRGHKLAVLEEGPGIGHAQ